MRAFGGVIAIGALLATGCSVQSEAGPEVTVTATATATTTATADPTPEPDIEPQPTAGATQDRAAAEGQPSITGDGPEADYLYMLPVTGVDLSPSTDAELLAAGRTACEALDSGVDAFFAGAMAGTELPEGSDPESWGAITAAAALYLCPEHTGKVT